MKLYGMILCALALGPATASAQFDFGGGDNGKPPWSTFKLNPRTRMRLNFHNANVDMVLGLFQTASGITIVKDPALKDPITITSAKPVSLDDAFQILKTTLGLRNYEMQKDGGLLVIRQIQPRVPVAPPTDAGTRGGGVDAATELKVYPIIFANATSLAQVLNDVYSPLPTAPGGGNQFQFGGPGGGRFNRGNRGGGIPTAGGAQTPVVRASSDDFSNSVIVNAPSRMQAAIGDLIKSLDKQTTSPEQAKVYKLKYANANDLAPVVQNVLVSNAPTGRGGQTNQNANPQARFQQALRLGSAQAAFGTVVADTRSNSLIVTATEENLNTVEKVIRELDTEVPVANTTFVFPLQNTRADIVATMLQQAFGTRAGFRGSTTSSNVPSGQVSRTTNNANSANQSRLPGSTGTGAGGATGIGGAPQANTIDAAQQQIDLALEDPNATSGLLQTNIAVQQGGGGGGGGGGGFRQLLGGGGGGGQSSGTNQQATVGRDAQGRLVNIRDLTGQVTVIPDINTNSLIVVTTPENIELLKQIVGLLDKIPQQVMIQTIIVEATLDASSKFGVEWKLVNPKSFGVKGVTGTEQTDFGAGSANPLPQGFRYTLTGGSLTSFLNALQTDTKFQVLSTPRIFTSNDAPASINISQSIPYVLSTRTDALGNLTYNYAFQDVGIVLTVTPRILSNGYVTMDVNQTANDLQGFTSFNAPIVNQREAQTTVSVKDGETIILGGIIRNNVTSTVNKIPLLGDLPLLGNLFRSHSKDNTKTELMVFLTPHVVTDPDEARTLRNEQIKEMSEPSQTVLKKAIPPTQPVKDGKGGGDGKNGGK